MKFKILDTKWKKQRRLEIILMILEGQPKSMVHLDLAYHLVINALDYDWIHPNY